MTENSVAYQRERGVGYILLSSGNVNYNNWNHSTPVVESTSSKRDVNIMPPYLTVYIWKRVA